MATIIKKGTYRFKDVVDVSNRVSLYFPFYFRGNIIDEPPYYDASEIGFYNYITIAANGTISYGGKVDCGGVYYSSGDFYTSQWDGRYKALYDFYKVEVPEAMGCGQTITIVKDTEVDNDTYAAWFLENTEPIEESEPVAAITYYGKIIGAIAKGQTATLPCNGKRMTGDIVITL